MFQNEMLIDRPVVLWQSFVVLRSPVAVYGVFSLAVSCFTIELAFNARDLPEKFRFAPVLQ